MLARGALGESLRGVRVLLTRDAEFAGSATFECVRHAFQ
jgi:hypothetical protein